MIGCHECGRPQIEPYSVYSHACLACGLRKSREPDATWLSELPSVLEFMLLVTIRASVTGAEDAIRFCFRNREQAWK